MTHSSDIYKIKAIVLISFFVVFLLFGGWLIRKFDCEWATINTTSIVYACLFVVTVAIFHKIILNSILSIRLENLKETFVVGTITFFAEAAAGIILYLLKIENINQNQIDNANLQSTLFLNITIVLFAPIVEEFVYRYCLFGLFYSHRWIAYAISIFAFSFMHVWDYVLIDGRLDQLASMLPYIVLGTGLTVIYERTEMSIAYPILLHMTINAFTVIY